MKVIKRIKSIGIIILGISAIFLSSCSNSPDNLNTNQKEKLTIVAKILAYPEKQELVKKELIKLIEITRLEEGCINYDLHQDNGNPNIFLFYENWANRDLWQKHMKNNHFAEFSKVTEGAIEEIVLNEMTNIE